MTRAQFLRDERGTAAVMVALMLPMLLGLGALVVDVGNARLTKNRMQAAADAAALAAVQDLSDHDGAVERALDYVSRNVPESFGEVLREEDVVFGVYDPSEKAFSPSAMDVNAIQINLSRETDRDNGLRRFLSVFAGTPMSTVRVSAIGARYFETVYQQPILKDRGFEAGDYNEIYAYCYDSNGTGSAASRRTQMTLIHRNVTPAVTITQWPDCSAEGLSMSFRLRNIRDSRTTVQAGRSPTGREYNHYTDTVKQDGREVFSSLNVTLIETMRCNTEDECRKGSQGGILPEGRGRTPNHETRACVPGQYMYYGWEDRPPEWGSSDRDYDDITFILKCTANSSEPSGEARLVR